MPFELLSNRIPPSTPAGKAKVIRAALDAGLAFREGMREIATRDDLAPKGKAALAMKHAAKSGAALRKAQRQLAYHEKKIDMQAAKVRAKAIGEPKATDAEYRAYLRSLPIGERIQKALVDPAARAAALREPGLSDINEDTISKILEIASRENAADELAKLTAMQGGQELHDAAVRVLTTEIMGAPFVLDNGRVRAPVSLHELESFLDANVAAVHQNMALLEEVEADGE